MNYNQILAYIAAWIIDNQNKEITAAIMRDVLDKLVNFQMIELVTLITLSKGMT